MTKSTLERAKKLDESKFNEYSGGDQQFEMCQNAARIAARNENARLMPLIEKLCAVIEAYEKSASDIDFCRVSQAPEDIEHIADKMRWVAREAQAKAKQILEGD